MSCTPRAIRAESWVAELVASNPGVPMTGRHDRESGFVQPTAPHPAQNESNFSGLNEHFRTNVRLSVKKRNDCESGGRSVVT